MSIWEEFDDGESTGTADDQLLIETHGKEPLFAREWDQQLVNITIPQIPTWLVQGNELAIDGKTSKALDIIFHQVNQILQREQFEELDQYIASTEVDEFSVDILLGLLTTTLPAKNNLPSRSNFFNRVKQSLEERKINDNGLLDGLE